MSQTPRSAPGILQPIPGVLVAQNQIIETANNVAQVVATNGNIALGNPPWGAVVVQPGGAVTGVTMDVGLIDQQSISVHNNSAFTLTFAALATSHVADGVADVIPANTVRCFIWLQQANSGNGAWFHVG